jgi:hypothetical protein
MNSWPPKTIESDITSDPKKVVEELYRLISFEAGELPQWDRFASLFTENAVMSLRLFPNDTEMWTGSPIQYAEVQVDKAMEESGYSETPISEQWTIYSAIAESRVIFDMQRGDEPPIRCIDGYHLIFSKGRWWVTSVLGEIPPPGTEPLDLKA